MYGNPAYMKGSEIEGKARCMINWAKGERGKMPWSFRREEDNFAVWQEDQMFRN